MWELGWWIWWNTAWCCICSSGGLWKAFCSPCPCCCHAFSCVQLQPCFNYGFTLQFQPHTVAQIPHYFRQGPLQPRVPALLPCCILYFWFLSFDPCTARPIYSSLDPRFLPTFTFWPRFSPRCEDTSAPIPVTSRHVGAAYSCQTKSHQLNGGALCGSFVSLSWCFLLKLYAESIFPTLFTSCSVLKAKGCIQKLPGHLEDKGMICPAVLLHCTSLLVNGENSANGLCNLNN